MGDAKEPTLSDVVEQLKINNLLLAAQIKASGTVEHHDLVLLLATTGASNDVIASILQTTPGAIKSLLHRERAKNKTEEKVEDG